MSNPFKQGDAVQVSSSVATPEYLSCSKLYPVVGVRGQHIILIDDDGDEGQYLHDYFVLHTASSPAATAVLAKQPMNGGNTFKVGEQVIPNAAIVKWWPASLTIGKVYMVTATGRNSVRVATDTGAEGEFAYTNFTLYTGGQAPPPTFKAAYNLAPDPTAVNDSDDEPSYDERKASAPVTSQGIFNAGQVVVYRDGTPTLTTLTVKRCTATCVWFEETYSAAFNPNEFTEA